jgi:hypothetical protein
MGAYSLLSVIVLAVMALIGALVGAAVFYNAGDPIRW